MKWPMVVALLLLAGGIQFTRGPVRDSLGVGGPAVATMGIAWNAVPCPASGARATGITFISHLAALGAGNAVLIVENNKPDGGTSTMCTLNVPCTISAGNTAKTSSSACDDQPLCEDGDFVHLEWASEACTLTPPDGAGSGILEAL